MSAVETAGNYVRQVVELRAKGWGDQAATVREFAHRYGLGFNTLERLRTGAAKSVDTDLFFRIRAAYLDLVERQIEKLQQQIAVEKAIAPDDDLEGFGIEAAALAAKIAQRKAAAK